MGLDERNAAQGTTPAINAAACGNASTLRALAALGANLDLADDFGFTPTYAAAEHGNVDALR